MHLTMSRPLSFVYRPLHSTINHRAAQRDDIVAVHCIVSCIVLCKSHTHSLLETIITIFRALMVMNSISRVLTTQCCSAAAAACTVLNSALIITTITYSHAINRQLGSVADHRCLSEPPDPGELVARASLCTAREADHVSSVSTDTGWSHIHTAFWGDCYIGYISFSCMSLTKIQNNPQCILSGVHTPREELLIIIHVLCI